MKFIHLYSGGLDSTVLLYDLLHQEAKVHCLLFNYGQKHLKELDCAEKICAHLNVPYDRVGLAPKIFYRSTLTQRDGQLIGRDTVVPNRNMVMIAIAASYALSFGGTAVSWAANADDAETYPDCRYEFFKAINEALRIADNRRMEVHAPYIQRSKRQVVEIGKRLSVPFESTWSCYTANTIPCGKCGACIQREAALSPMPATISNGYTWSAMRRHRKYFPESLTGERDNIAEQLQGFITMRGLKGRVEAMTDQIDVFIGEEKVAIYMCGA